MSHALCGVCSVIVTFQAYPHIHIIREYFSNKKCYKMPYSNFSVYMEQKLKNVWKKSFPGIPVSLLSENILNKWIKCYPHIFIIWEHF